MCRPKQPMFGGMRRSRKMTKALVTKADGQTVRVKSLEESISKELENIGFSYDAKISEYVILVADNPEKARIFESLRDLDICFSAGKEWCPSEVFEYLRDIGLLKGSFYRISWKSPTHSEITTV